MLLIRLAAQNLGRGRLRAVLLGAAVALAVGVSVASFITGWAVRDGIATSFARMGADLAVVPRGTLVNLTTSLLTVEPTEQTLDASVVDALSAIEGVSRAAAQRIVRVSVEGRGFNLIAFDPATDFTVTRWLRGDRSAPVGVSDLIAGAAVPGAAGESLSVCRQPLDVHGRLGRTGVGPFDESYFISFAGLDMLAALCGNDTQLRALRSDAAHAGHPAEAVCMPDYVHGRVSAVLLELDAGAHADQVKFAISRIAGVEVVEGNPILTQSRQSLRSLLLAAGVFAFAVALALCILVSLVFSGIVQERLREIGLMRAIGATPRDVVGVVLAEAAMVTGLGGVCGLVLGAALLSASTRTIGYYLETLGVPQQWPPIDVLVGTCVAAVTASVLIGTMGALFPAWRVRRFEPYALIQGESAP